MAVSPLYLLDPDDGPLHATATPHEVRLAGSSPCEEWCCGALYVTVRREGQQVVWAGWRNPASQDLDLPELRFDVDQYEAEVNRAATDRGWEWPAGAVARLLQARLRRHEDWLETWDCEVEGIGAPRTEPDRIHVVLMHPRIRTEADQPWLQFGITLPVSQDDPVDSQAAHLQARLTAGDPRAIAEVWGGSEAYAEQLGYPWPH
ncbi:hypothetical protein ACF07B_21010 [Streptomyces sp. NPDC015532]|uniref:hypothetical protein n=1 Tax=Streptomyces sp. NPDC015532 TaxID=3364960 RepID=UPI0036FB4A1D